MDIPVFSFYGCEAFYISYVLCLVDTDARSGDMICFPNSKLLLIVSGNKMDGLQWVTGEESGMRAVHIVAEDEAGWG